MNPDLGSSRKYLLQMSGAPGSGKSTLARLISSSINGIVIDHDLLRSFFLENTMSFDQAAKLAYNLQWSLAEDMIKQERNVIIDCVCNYPEIIERGKALAGKYQYEYKFVECRVENLEVLDRRLQERTPLRSQRRGLNAPPPDVAADDPRRTADGLQLLQQKMQNPCRPAAGVIVVDSTKNSEKCRDLVLQQIS